jgi:hypothetical protein
MVEKQIHILVGCADARDLSQVQLDAIDKVTKIFAEQGIEVELHTIRAAGSFMSPDVVMDIKRTFEQAQRGMKNLPSALTYFVHIQTHGHLTEDSNDQYISHVHDLKIVEGSPLNCGMLGASSLGIEIEKMIITESPEVNLRGKLVKIDSDSMIRRLLKEVYAYDGYLAGDWVKSIDLLRTHPRHQRTVLERAIAIDPELKMLNIKVTSGILDYGIHSLIRVDDGDPAVPFWDQVQQEIRKNSQNDRNAKDILINQSQKQKPLAGLLCMAAPNMSSRRYAARYYMKYKNIEYAGAYLPNTLFNMSGTSFDIPHTPFGPYVIAGFFFAVHSMGLTDQMVMGYNQEQTDRIVQKMKNDPIISLIIRKYQVKLLPINMVDLQSE